MQKTDIEDLERTIKQAQADVDFGRLIQRLKSNRDFQKVVLEGYFREEAVRLVHLKADPNMQAAHIQAAILRDIDAIGAFQAYLNAALVKADRSGDSITSTEEMLAEARAEAVGD